MGYTTSFSGQITIVPALDADEIAFLQKFSETRRMCRKCGPYFVGGSGDFGQGRDPDVIDYNRPDPSQPGLWCQWRPTEDGSAIEWNEAEKFYDSAEWMKYLIVHFLKPGAEAVGKVEVLKGGHVLNGVIEAQGEDSSDRWDLLVKDNKVTVRRFTQVVGAEEEV